VDRLATRSRQDAEFAMLLQVHRSGLHGPQRDRRDPPFAVGQGTVTAGRDAYTAGGDISIFISATREASYPEAEHPAAEGQTGLAIGMARVLRDLDRVSRGREATEGTDEPALERLINHAVNATLPYPYWLAWPARRMWAALDAVGVPVSQDHVRGQAGRLRDWLDEHGVDPRALIPRLPGHAEALAQWSPGDGDPGNLTARLGRALASELGRDKAALLPDLTLRLLRQALSERGARDFVDALDKQLQEPISSRIRPPGGQAGRSPAERRSLVRELPGRRWDLTGREQEVREVASQVTKLLSERRSATVFLSGQPGVGKSVIAIEAARKLRDAEAFPGGVLYFNMRGDIKYSADGMATSTAWVSPHQVAADVLTILGAAGDGGDAIPESAEELYATYTRALTGRQVLVVLDHALDAGQVRPLLQAGDSSCVLVTTRKTTAAVVPPPRCDWKLEVAAFAREVSMELLQNHVEDFDGSASVEGSVPVNVQLDRIAGYCADLPHALFLAGEEMKSSRYAGAAGQRLELFADALEAESGRLGKLKGTAVLISLSYLNLDSAARRVLRMSCTTRATGITGRELGFCLDSGDKDAEDNLGRLVDGSLATCGAGPSYALYEMVRLFADVRREVEDPQDAVTAFHRRFVEYIRRQVEADGGSYPGLDNPAELAAALKAADLAAKADSPAALTAGIVIAERLVTTFLPGGAEFDRLVAAQKTLADLYDRAGHAEQALHEWLSLAERMRDRQRRPEAIDAYQRARLAAGGDEELSRLKADAAFALGLLLAQGNDPDLVAAFGAMSDSAETLLALRLPDEGQKILALPVASNCVELAERLQEHADHLRWAHVAAGIARECHAANLGSRAAAMFDLGHTLFTRQAADALSSFDLAGQWYEQDRQFENAASAAWNAALLAPKEDQEGHLRTAIRRSESARWLESKTLQAKCRVRLSALLAEDGRFEDAIEVLVPASKLLSYDADRRPQARELRMRLLALRLLAGGSVDPADAKATATYKTWAQRGEEAQALMLYRLARGLTSVAEERSRLLTLVCKPWFTGAPAADKPRTPPLWLNRELGKPTGPAV
jgi:hypothetical protein